MAALRIGMSLEDTPTNRTVLLALGPVTADAVVESLPPSKTEI